MDTPKKAILIGFNYKRTKNRQNLPGIIIDLYRTYQYCLYRGYTVRILTDFNVEEDRGDYIQSLIDNTIDEGIIEFSEALSPCDAKYLTELITQELDGERHSLVYYTGHFTNNYFVPPVGREISLSRFKTVLNNSIDHAAQLVLLTDCCYSNNIKGSYRVKIDHKQLKYLLQEEEYSNRDLIIIGQDTEKVPMDNNGSGFTLNVINYLRTRHSDTIGALLVAMNKHCPLVHTSIFKQDFLYSWV
jgi:hypothetical protein